MMLGVPFPETFEPKEDWFQGFDGPFGVWWAIGWSGSLDGVLVPHGSDKKLRQLMQWAYEQGHAHGAHRGEECIKRNIRNLLGIFTS